LTKEEEEKKILRISSYCSKVTLFAKKYQNFTKKLLITSRFFRNFVKVQKLLTLQNLLVANNWQFCQNIEIAELCKGVHCVKSRREPVGVRSIKVRRKMERNVHFSTKKCKLNRHTPKIK